MSGSTIQRQPVLRKAAAREDLVASITSSGEQGREERTTQAPSESTASAAPVVSASAVEATPPTVAPRRGPGRPRNRRRMEPFSSKIEIGLRDLVDAYTIEHDESIVDLLDRALRAAIGAPPGPTDRS